MRLKTPEDIERLPGYIPKVDPQANPLNRIIEHYYIRPFDIKCGLCGRVHMEGCIVELEDLKITNIGHVCGSKFGEKFNQEREKNYENVYKPRLIQAIAQAQAKFAADQFRLNELCLQADDLARRESDFSSMFPGLLETLRRRASSNISRVSESLRRSNEEIDDLMAANPFQSREDLAFKEQHIGTVRGFRLPLHNWSRISGLRKVFTELAKFIDLKPRTLSMGDLQHWAHWAEDFEENLVRTIVGLEDGRNFFSPSNFQLFAVLAPSDAMKAQLRALQVKDIKSPRVAISDERPKPVSTLRRGPSGKISAKQLRRLTGDKKAR